MILSIIIILIILLMGLALLVGIVLYIVGRLKKDNGRRLRKAGLIVGGIPIGIIGIIFLITILGKIFATEPDEEDLIGKYQIVEATNLDIDRTEYHSYILELRHDHRFAITPISDLEICQTGEYEYFDNSGQLYLRCGSHELAVAQTVGLFGNLKFEFIIGDPDSGKSIYFEKIND